MEKLFNEFGFEPTFFVAQVINFLILAFIFKKFLYKPVLKTLNDRKKAIAKGLADAEKAGVELAKAEEAKDEIIKKATSEAEKIIEETKKASIVMREEILEQSRLDAKKIITEARALIDDEKKKANTEVKDTAFEISKKVLSKILDDLFTKQEKEKILARDIKKLSDYE